MDNPSPSEEVCPACGNFKLKLPLWHPRARKADIARGICEEYGVTQAVLTGRDVAKRSTVPRHALMSALHEAGYSYSQIGRFLNRHHTTVMYGVHIHQARES